MTDRDELEMLAAEYVLGTLEEGERSSISARRRHDSDLDIEIAEWETRLSPLLAYVGDAKPRRDLLAEIQKRIAEGQTSEAAAEEVVADIGGLQRSRNQWRMAALATSAIAACLAGFIILDALIFKPAEQNFVAVFQEGDEPPQFLLSINLKTRELSIRPVAAQPHPGKTYQLWIASDQLGPSPRSLGLLEAPEKPTRKRLQQFDAELLEAATFGISLEPSGGSPTGRPTGPALHGKLFPTAL